MKKEIILCSAIKYFDTIVCGRRHKDCNEIIEQLTDNPDFESERQNQGFLTNKNRFVNRIEAYKIAFENDQIVGPNKGYADNEFGLTSEDLFGMDDL